MERKVLDTLRYCFVLFQFRYACLEIQRQRERKYKDIFLMERNVLDKLKYRLCPLSIPVCLPRDKDIER